MERELLIEAVDMDRGENGKLIWLSNVVVRYITYFFIVVILISIFGIIVNGNHAKLSRITDISLFLFPFALSGYIEWSILKFRKKYDFPKWKGITKEYNLRVMEDRAIIESRAVNNSNSNVKTSESKKGLDYWFDLKQKGAISEEEYEKKKKELL